jgi:mRNA interferase MazF
MSTPIERGDVYWTALDPVIGSELAKTRPCVVVSATEVNTVRRTVVIVPLTTTSAPPNWPLLIELPTFTAKTRARIEQVRVIDKSRLRQQIDTMDATAMQQIEMALAVVLGFHQ